MVCLTLQSSSNDFGHDKEQVLKVSHILSKDNFIPVQYESNALEFSKMNVCFQLNQWTCNFEVFYGKTMARQFWK